MADTNPPGSTPDFDFFTNAATSFKPRPYARSDSSNIRNKPAQSTKNTHTQRSIESIGVQPPGMDPSPKDPNVVFIHPPFTTFPNSHLHLGGLNFTLLTENPDWFLDPNDFISPDSSNPNAIPYPPYLEPPRGWCPAKKRVLRERGSDSWPEGEEPRLRCTFCRRTYAGVNAKSMWRRHVFEKHKIAMSNRRDTSERPRGRASTKENRQPNETENAHESIVSLEIAPQTDTRSASSKFQFRSTEPVRKRRRSFKPASVSTAESSDVDTPQPSSETSVTPPTPPATPQFVIPADIDSSSVSVSLIPLVPDSPYDPSATPSFRHSLPSLPSEQPWRYPSPTHPLHSRQRDLSLSMLGAMPSPTVSGLLDSPTPLGTPFSKHVKCFETPESLPKRRPTLLTKADTFPLLSERFQFKEGSSRSSSLQPLDPVIHWEDTCQELEIAPPSPRINLLQPFRLRNDEVDTEVLTLFSDKVEDVAFFDEDELGYPESTPPCKKRKTTEPSRLL